MFSSFRPAFFFEGEDVTLVESPVFWFRLLAICLLRVRVRPPGAMPADGLPSGCLDSA